MRSLALKKISADVIVRFHAKYKKTEICWLWTDALTKQGYGIIWDIKNRKLILAHRASVVIYGRKIPAGMCIDHICRRRSCVNPEHLRVVTPGQNTLENSNSIPAKHKAKTHCKNGHEFTIHNTEIYSQTSKNPWRRCKLCRAKWHALERERRSAKYK